MFGDRNKKNYYLILGVAREASHIEVKTAFRKLAGQFHPDKNPGDATSEAKFKEINEAFQVLGDADKRFIYDGETRRPNVGSKASGIDDDIGSMMDDLFNETDFAPFKRQPSHSVPRQNASTQDFFTQQVPGDDITIDVVIDLEESITGCKKPVTVRGPRPNIHCSVCNGSGSKPGTRRIACSTCAGHGKHINYNGSGFGPGVRMCKTCNGMGTVALAKCKPCSGSGKTIFERELEIQIPAGVSSGQQLRVAGQGTPGHPPGDLFITIKIAPNRSFTRVNLDIHTTKKISLRHAICGGPMIFPGPSGEEIHVEVPPGTQPGSAITLKGAGVASPINTVKGNMIVIVNVIIPKTVNTRALKLIDELMDELARTEDE